MARRWRRLLMLQTPAELSPEPASPTSNLRSPARSRSNFRLRLRCSTHQFRPPPYLRFSATKILVASSWDNQVRCWEMQRSGTSINTVPKAAITHDQPVLCSAWKDDGTTGFSGGCDKQVKMCPLLAGGQAVQVAVHDALVKELAWNP